MAAADRRRGRRDNGLDATDWRAIEDLDPRVSEDVLDGLGARGIAAYVQPAVDVDPVTRSATLPGSPRDRLYVDRQRAQAARDWVRQLLERRAPEPCDGPDPDTGPSYLDAGTSSQAGVDATFAGIVAVFDRPVDPTAASWPAAEELSATWPGNEASDTATAAARDDAPAAAPVDGRHVTEPSLLDALDAWDARPDEPDDDAPEEFVPPPPPPLPRLSGQTVLGAVAVVAGLVLILGRPSVLPFDRGATMLLGFATMVGGAAALILRLRPDAGDDDPAGRRPDDGAQV